MIFKKFVRAAAAAAALTTAGVGMTAAPASAAEAGVSATTLNFPGGQAQFDNNPGNGAQSWVWVWNNSQYSGTVRVDYQLYNGTIGSLQADWGQGHSLNLAEDIWRIRGCWHIQNWSCTDWT
ncbi:MULTISPECIES: hypothetical protein [Streptomyces]|uniref:Uncharacterized protein n=2 Tax=Streptomyces cadmiisoli TaxID=2184053 RepID=A0A2Z4J9D2_9ACTN|nr:hypothetical protein [Streptomyces sp. AS58]AWW41741.1 hypothetical protein DN051_38120 [Streptomyces cadmiisoli]